MKKVGELNALVRVAKGSRRKPAETDIASMRKVPALLGKVNFCL